MSGVRVISLDSDNWLIATDPDNIGQRDGWWKGPQPGAREIKVPWIIQDTFVGYSGVAWYWQSFDVPVNPDPNGRYLLRFWAVDYKADVWVNDVCLGSHEHGDMPFTIDATETINPGKNNRLVVRVLVPGNERIDDMVLAEVPHHAKTEPYCAGLSFNYGGITDSVELLTVPAVRVDDVCLRPDWKTGEVRVRLSIFNALPEPISGSIILSIAPQLTGDIIESMSLQKELPAGETVIEAVLNVGEPHLWSLDDPYLYRVTARVQRDETLWYSESSARCGFRDFRFERGYFRLNGRRIYIKSTHTGNHAPLGLHMPTDPGMFRRDLLHLKVMGFNVVRFIAGAATRYQLDLCDEIGLLVHEEPISGWFLQDSPKMPKRYDMSLSQMILRDRNHPSIVMWGLLNETFDGPVFRHALSTLPMVRQLDDSRLVMLDSGKFYNSDVPAGISMWSGELGRFPCVTCNRTTKPIYGFGPINNLGAKWKPGQMTLTPGDNGEYSVARWTAPSGGEYEISATFSSATYAATTDVHIFAAGKSLFSGGVNILGEGSSSSYAGSVRLDAGECVDFIVGYGNGANADDTTLLAATIKSSCGDCWDAAGDFLLGSNPNDVWSYGWLASGEQPDISTFSLYSVGDVVNINENIGCLSNPGSDSWEDVLEDQHDYPWVPHSAENLHMLRTMDGGGHPVYLSEYGVGSLNDLVRIVRHFERLGRTDAEDAEFYRECLDKFFVDWKQWQLDDIWVSPEEYFRQGTAKMAAERIRGISAVRANPNIISCGVTGAVDQGMCGEGMANTFRELKPGAVDAMVDLFSPLRLCMFAEPYSIYRGSNVKLDAVLVNEDTLRPGDYPIRLQVIGPDNFRVCEKTVVLRIPDSKAESPYALPVSSEDLRIDGPEGKYRFIAAFEEGGAATGGETEFYVTDPVNMPKTVPEVVFWGEDSELVDWLSNNGIRCCSFTDNRQDGREVILVGRKPAAGGLDAWNNLIDRITHGSSAVFLWPGVFAERHDLLAHLPLANKGNLERLRGWLYLKDEWCKNHPIFDGLPSGGFMDYTFYREIIPDLLFVGQDSPDEVVSGAIKAARGYRSGLFTAVYNIGSGRIILNTLRIEENLGKHPAAERLLRNMLNYAAV